MVVEKVRRHADLDGLRSDVAHGGARRLLHHAAQLAGEDHVVVTRRKERRLDEQDVASRFRPRQAGCHAGPRHAERHLVVESRRAKIIGDGIGANGCLPVAASADAMRAAIFLTTAPMLTFEAADAGLARVVHDDSHDRVIVERHRRCRQRVFLELARHEIPLRDVELLFGGVARPAR